MRITFVTGGFEYGGAQRVMCNLANKFEEEGNEVSIITFAHSNNATYYLNKNVKWVNGIGWNNYIDGIFKLRKIIKVENPDIVISFVTIYNIATCIALLGTGIPIIVSERNDPVHVPPEKFKRFLRWIFYRFAKGYVFQTNQAKDFFNKKIRKNSIVIPNPLFLDRKAPDVKNRQHRVLAAARFVEQKNHMMLVKAFTKAVDLNTDWKLDIYGEGEENYINEIKSFIGKNNMDNHINIFPASSDIYKEMATHSIFVLTSNFEGMPNSLMEAMGMGMACISTDCPCGGPAFLIESGKNGILVPVNSVSDLTDSLKQLMDSEEIRYKLAEKAKEIRYVLDMQKIYREWDEYIRKISKK